MPTAVHIPSANALFRGHYCFRSLNGTMAFLVLFLFGGISAYTSSQILLKDGGSIQFTTGIGFACFALLFGGLGLYVLSCWIANKRIEVEINEDGIINGTCFWPWNEINSFTGKKYLNGVCLEFSSRWRTVSAPTTPHLTEQQYIELAHELRRRVVVRFPNIDLAMRPVDASDN